MDGKDLGGRSISVSFAQDKPRSDSRGGGGGGGGERRFGGGGGGGGGGGRGNVETVDTGDYRVVLDVGGTKLTQVLRVVKVAPGEVSVMSGLSGR
jgi:hypothetical protein